MIRTFFLIRHAVTEWNKIGRLQGHTDIPLSESGIIQAQNLQPIIAKLSPEIIYSSPLQRALQTASLASQSLHQKVLTDERLMEVKLGSIEGLTGSEVSAQFGEASLERWRNLDWSDDFAYPNGERKLESVERIKDFLRQEFNYQKIAVVSHGLILRRFLGRISNNKDFIRIKNTMVFEVEYNSEKNEFKFLRTIYEPT